MEINLETMLDIALGGPEIGPLNLQVLHGIMREVFLKMNLSSQKIVVEKESPEFSDSFNFIKSRIDEKNRRPKTAGGSPQKFKSNVSVIVSDYARVPIGDKSKPSLSLVPLPNTNEIEDRLRYIESELKNVKDFPSVDELRNWAKEKANPDTVVTDLWHFVSLNHRVNGLEEGIQKLSALVDKLIPEIKTVIDEQSIANGKIDDLFSQFIGLSDRTTYIDNKIDGVTEDINKTFDKQVDTIRDHIKCIENKLVVLPKFKDLNMYVTTSRFHEVREMAREVEKDFRDQLDSKVNYSILSEMVGKDDLQSVVDTLNSVDARLMDCAKTSELGNFVTNDTLTRVKKNADEMVVEINKMNVSLNAKADISNISILALKSDVEKLSKEMERVVRLPEQQTDLYNNLLAMEDKLKKKADNDDIVDVLKKEDMKKTFSRIQNHQSAINEIQNWLKCFDTEEKPTIHSKVNNLIDLTSEIKESFSIIQSQPKVDIDNVAALQTSLEQLTYLFNEHDKTYKSNISGIINNIELKLDKAEIQPLRDYLENLYETLVQQYQESMDDGHHCSKHHIHQPKAPVSQGMPHISLSSINISKKRVDDHGFNTDAFLQSKSDAAAVRSQMKFNCLSCSQPLGISAHNQYQTVRGKPLNAYELDHLKLLQKMLEPESVDIEVSRPCGGKHTSSMFYKKSSRTSAKSLPAMAFANSEGALVDGEVDIEGLDGKLYKGLISRKDLVNRFRCKSANAELRTVTAIPGSGRDRPVSGKSISDFRPSTARVIAS